MPAASQIVSQFWLLSSKLNWNSVLPLLVFWFAPYSFWRNAWSITPRLLMPNSSHCSGSSGLISKEFADLVPVSLYAVTVKIFWLEFNSPKSYVEVTPGKLAYPSNGCVIPRLCIISWAIVRWSAPPKGISLRSILCEFKNIPAPSIP